MADAVALTNYMRDYIWSIGIERMRPAGVNIPAPTLATPRPVPSTPPATQSQIATAESPRRANAVASATQPRATTPLKEK